LPALVPGIFPARLPRVPFAFGRLKAGKLSRLAALLAAPGTAPTSARELGDETAAALAAALAQQQSTASKADEVDVMGPIWRVHKWQRQMNLRSDFLGGKDGTHPACPQWTRRMDGTRALFGWVPNGTARWDRREQNGAP
jgi:hypothetical protein